MRQSRSISLSSLLLAACLGGGACGSQTLVFDIDLRRDPCNEAAGECCETYDLSPVRSCNLELTLDDQRTSLGCEPVADLSTVAPIGRPLLIEQALSAGTIPSVDQGQWSVRVVGFDGPGCPTGRAVLCGRGQLTVAPEAQQRRSLSMIIRCSPELNSPKQSSVQRCMEGQL